MMYTDRETEDRSARLDSSGAIDLAGFLRYMYQRRRLVTVAALIAVVLTAVGSFLTPAKYSATASILIEPPAGDDPRGATAVSPVYLESLKTYEHFAWSDSLFQQALAHLKLKDEYPGVPIERLKLRILKVKKPKDEKILEISATLRDRVKAQQLAEYIAEQTIALNRSLELDSTHDLSRDATNLVQAAQTRLENARAAREHLLADGPIAGLEAQLAGATELKAQIDRELTDASVELAAVQGRLASQHSEKTPVDGAVNPSDLAAVRAQVSALHQQSVTLEGQVTTYSGLLEKRKQQREVLEKEVQAAQAQYEAAITRKMEVLSSSAFRGERLEIIDPGVVPERPSSPNIALNLAIALFGSTICSILYLAIRFGFHRMQLLQN